MEIDERMVTGFFSRIASSLEGIQESLAAMAETERLSYEMSIDTAAKTNALTGEMAGAFQQIMPGLSGLLGEDPEPDSETP